MTNYEKRIKIVKAEVKEASKKFIITNKDIIKKYKLPTKPINKMTVDELDDFEIHCWEIRCENNRLFKLMDGNKILKMGFRLAHKYMRKYNTWDDHWDKHMDEFQKEMGKNYTEFKRLGKESNLYFNENTIIDLMLCHIKAEWKKRQAISLVIFHRTNRII